MSGFRGVSKTQLAQIIAFFLEGSGKLCGGLRGGNPGAFPKAGPIFQQPLSLPENAQTLAGIAFGAARKSVKNFRAASKFAGIFFQQGLSDSHSLEFSEKMGALNMRSLAVGPPKSFTEMAAR